MGEYGARPSIPPEPGHTPPCCVQSRWTQGHTRMLFFVTGREFTIPSVQRCSSAILGGTSRGLGRAHEPGILPAAEAGGSNKPDFLSALSHTHSSNKSCKDLCSPGWPPPPLVLLLSLAQQLSPASRFTYK